MNLTAPLSPVAFEFATFLDPESEVTPHAGLALARPEGLNPDVATGAVPTPAPVADPTPRWHVANGSDLCPTCRGIGTHLDGCERWHPSDAAVYGRGRNAGGAA